MTELWGNTKNTRNVAPPFSVNLSILKSYYVLFWETKTALTVQRFNIAHNMSPERCNSLLTLIPNLERERDALGWPRAKKAVFPLILSQKPHLNQRGQENPS